MWKNAKNPWKIEIPKRYAKIAERFKHTCLLMSINDLRSAEQATKDYNKEHNTDIDFRFCALFRYNNLETLTFGSPEFYFYKEFILL